MNSESQRHAVDRERGAEPEVEDRHEGGLGHGIRHDQVGIEHFVKSLPPPQDRGNRGAKHDRAGESEHRCKHCCPCVGENAGLLRGFLQQLDECWPQGRWVAGKHRVQDVRFRQKFPKHEKHDEDRELRSAHDEPAPPLSSQPFPILRARSGNQRQFSLRHGLRAPARGC
jgi:hypothetical protein